MPERQRAKTTCGSRNVECDGETSLEYAGELWGGEISDALTREVEKVQTDFGRTILGIKGEMWVPAEFVRAER